MAQPKGGELGARRPLALRVGQRDFEFQGLQNEWDPGGIDLGAFQDAVNVHFKGGRACCRGGLTKYGDAVSGEIIGLYDDDEDYVDPGAGGDTAYWDGGVGEGTLFVHGSPVTYPTLLYDGGSVAVVESPLAYPAETLVQAGIDGNLYISIYDQIEGRTEIYELQGDPGLEEWVQVQTYADGISQGVFNWDDGLIYFYDGANGKILSFDPSDYSLTVVDDGTAPVDYDHLMYYDDLYLVSAGGLYKRDGGTWTQTALPDIGDADYSYGSSNTYARTWCIHDGVLYFAIGSYDSSGAVNPKPTVCRILSWDGTDLELAHSTGTSSAESGFPPVALMTDWAGGTLHFLATYDEQGPNGAGIFYGSFNGTAWSENETAESDLSAAVVTNGKFYSGDTLLLISASDVWESDAVPPTAWTLIADDLLSDGYDLWEQRVSA